MRLETISVFGLGRVGLVTAACLARNGYRVVGIDPDPLRVRQISRAEPPFFEPHLREYVREVVGKGKLTVTQDSSWNARSDLALIVVGTPPRRDGSINLTYVRDATRAIGKSIRNTDHHQLVVIKSTVTPDAARRLVKPVLERESGGKVGKDIDLCSNPEFLREGNAIHDTEFPDRIIIGGEDPEAIRKLEQFYVEFHRGNLPPIIRTTHENAALIKYANNAFLATKVSFMNCIANIAERIPGGDADIIAAGIGLDQRIGSLFLRAGLGWGGSCFPKDLAALTRLSKMLGYNPEMIEAAERTNHNQWRRAIELAKRALGRLDRKRIAILGLAFKPDTDDMRAAVSVPIIKYLLAHGARIVVYDPAAMENARAIFGPQVKYARDLGECLGEADCCIVVTEWDVIKAISPRTYLEKMRCPIVVDGRRVYEPEKFASIGIQLLAVGLGERI
jgi:UDPglucose 6-dehydrogenase